MLADLKARLEAALGDTPVLAPEDRMKPLEGDKPGSGPKGLARYFLSHPGGFVQLNDPTPVLTSGGVRDVSLVLIDVFAPTMTAAEALAKTIRDTLAPPRVGGAWQVFAPPRPETAPGGARLTLQFQVLSTST